MADGVFNVSKGRIVEFYNRVKSNDPANSAFVIVLLKLSESDALLIDRLELDALLAAAANTEADFTNIGARKVKIDSDLVALPAPDTGNDRYDVDMPDITWSAAGNGANNSLVKLLICYDSDTTGGTDVNVLPCCHYDFTVTTDGSDITAQINTAGFFRAS